VDLVFVAPDFEIGRLHEQEFEIIWCSQLLRDTRLAHSFLPEDRTDLPTQPIPALLVIIHNRAVKM